MNKSFINLNVKRFYIKFSWINNYVWNQLLDDFEGNMGPSSGDLYRSD